jgi:hypothetical protein
MQPVGFSLFRFGAGDREELRKYRKSDTRRGLLHLGAAKQFRQLDEDFKDVLYWAPVSDATWDRTASDWLQP